MQDLKNLSAIGFSVLFAAFCNTCHGSVIAEKSAVQSIGSSDSKWSSSAIHGTFSLTPSITLGVNLTAKNFGVFLQLKNSLRAARGLMDKAESLLPVKASSPMFSYVLTPALALAGLIPWVVPGISLAAGFVQLINQMAFTAGLSALVRSYIFDAKPDEHVVYVNSGYGSKGHTKHHRPGEV
ncbi:hypothetical protein D910_12447 [Dendroctonus ponderosae]|uniref:Uncharacterized protein n=1 Tax=Dendroctonus ponderosae TaxID=77166 RepID=U4URN7_DENPD|nr:hypothetical protein D910_12447 [Dendroctonus ponderosae]